MDKINTLYLDFICNLIKNRIYGTKNEIEKNFRNLYSTREN